LPRARDLLNRFRPSGTPGAAGAAAVPVDRAAGAAAELAPVFAALAPTERRCEELLAEAQADARRLRREAEEEAERLVAVARDRQATERAAVLAELRARRSADAAAAADAARRQAVEVGDRAEARMAGCVADVVAAVRSLVAAP
jgi:hypothetical protein